jgi:phage-related protein
MPDSRPMPTVGSRCHELRIADIQSKTEWRIIYRVDPDAIVIGDVFRKTTRTTPKHVIEQCQRRFARYDSA